MAGGDSFAVSVGVELCIGRHDIDSGALLAVELKIDGPPEEANYLI
jgi:hypothetical protein